AGEILPAGSKRLAGLRVELDDVLLQLLRLDLQPLLRSDDVGDAALDVLQGLQLALVRVVERLARVLRAVQQRVPFRLDDLAGSGQQAHRAPPRLWCPGSVPPCSSNGACTQTGSRTPISSRTRR